MLCTRITPFSPSMKGIVKPKCSRNSRFTVPLRPKISCIATAPTKGGMISGMKPRLWTTIAPPKLKRVVI
jgi:hypothetical protein